MGAAGMGALPVGDVFATDAQQMPTPSAGLFVGGLEQNWNPSVAPAAHWGGQSSWNGGSGAPPPAQGASSADWGLGGLGVNADLNPGTPSWSTFAGTSPTAGPGVWSTPNDLSVDVGRMNLDARQQQAAQRSPGTPDGDPNLIDSSLLSFLG